MNANLKAFLDTIAFSEGTYGYGSNGYNVVVGRTFFQNYADHPRRKVFLPKLKIYSTAAGRYQLLMRYWDAYRKQLNLEDFSPASQDAVAIQQIKECRAYEDICLGRFDEAVRKVARIWASFPGAGYGQRENKLSKLRDFYVSVGGKFHELAD